MQDTQTQTSTPALTGNPQSIVMPDNSQTGDNPQAGTLLDPQSLPATSYLQVTNGCDQLCSTSTNIPVANTAQSQTGPSLNWLIPAVIIIGFILISIKVFTNRDKS